MFARVSAGSFPSTALVKPDEEEDLPRTKKKFKTKIDGEVSDPCEKSDTEMSLDGEQSPLEGEQSPIEGVKSRSLTRMHL